VIDRLLRFTPVDWAVFSRKKEIAELLRKHGGKDRHWFASEKSIHVAARVGHIEAVKKHLEAGVDVNVKGQGGIGDATPLHYASRFAKKEIVALLISNGADVNAKNVDGSKPLDWAVGRRHVEIADLLRKHGGKSGMEDSIHLAAKSRNTVFIKNHIAADMGLNSKNEHGETPLDVANKYKRTETIRLLRKHGGKTGEELKGGEPAGALATDLTSLSPGRNEVQIKHDGQSRRLIITTPKTFGHQGPYPVLFCFHGAGGKAEGQSKRWSPHADERGLIVISAEAVQPQAKWNFRDKFHAEEHDDVGFVLKVVEALITNKIVDPKAVYATGHSSGGLFCYRLAKETVLFAALSPMSCGMVKGAHDPGEKTKPVSIMQVIGDQDKSFNGSSNPKVTMYSAAKRIDVWRTFNRCRPDPVVVNKGEEVVVYTYANQSGIEVAFCKVKGQGHHIRRDLRDIGDSAALDFLLKHKRERNRDD